MVIQTKIYLLTLLASLIFVVFMAYIFFGVLVATDAYEKIGGIIGEHSKMELPNYALYSASNPKEASNPASESKTPQNAPQLPINAIEMQATITSYCLTGKMANGEEVSEGSIACPRHIKFGVKVEIDGQEYVCKDRLSLRYDDYWDLWKEDCQKSLEWGKRIKKIKIYEEIK